MVKDALDGKIDLILTKSVSRFARNTVDTLTTIRKLKERGVAVYFEEQSINTLDGKGELLITIMSSIAQEESRSISDNVTWGQRKRFADGKVSLGYKHFLGYEKGEDGLPQIVEEEGLFFALADVITIYHDGRVVVRFRDGVEIEPSPISSSKTAYSAHFAMNALSWLAKLCGMQNESVISFAGYASGVVSAVPLAVLSWIAKTAWKKIRGNIGGFLTVSSN